MLDTNIVSHMISHPLGHVGRRVEAMDDGAVAISIIVAAELLFGVERKVSPRLTARVADVLRSKSVLPLSSDSEAHYARIRTMLERRGTPIGANDLFIAAHAMAIGATLVTDDGDFARVEGLAVENWLRD